MTVAESSLVEPQVLPEPNAGGRAVRRGQRAPMLATSIFLVLVVLLVLAPFLPIADPLEQNVADRWASPSRAHWLGLDGVGRDLFSRVVWGARQSLIGMVCTVGIAAAIGIPWGLVAGYFGGWVDEILMRLADGVLAIPGIVLAIAIVGVTGPSLFNAMMAIGFVFAPTMARLMRSHALPLMRADFVSAARLAGTSRWRAMWRHVFPNSMGPVFVQLCSLASLALIIEAGLSFLGFAVQPPKPSLGSDLANAYLQFNSAPWGTIATGLAITLLAFLISRVGDEFRVRFGVK